MDLSKSNNNRPIYKARHYKMKIENIENIDQIIHEYVTNELMPLIAPHDMSASEKRKLMIFLTNVVALDVYGKKVTLMYLTFSTNFKTKFIYDFKNNNDISSNILRKITPEKLPNNPNQSRYTCSQLNIRNRKTKNLLNSKESKKIKKEIFKELKEDISRNHQVQSLLKIRDIFNSGGGMDFIDSNNILYNYVKNSVIDFKEILSKQHELFSEYSLNNINKERFHLGLNFSKYVSACKALDILLYGEERSMKKNYTNEQEYQKALKKAINNVNPNFLDKMLSKDSNEVNDKDLFLATLKESFDYCTKNIDCDKGLWEKTKKEMIEKYENFDFKEAIFQKKESEKEKRQIAVAIAAIVAGLLISTSARGEEIDLNSITNYCKQPTRIEERDARIEENNRSNNPKILDFGEI